MEWEQKGILEAYGYVIDDRIHTKLGKLKMVERLEQFFKYDWHFYLKQMKLTVEDNQQLKSCAMQTQSEYFIAS